MSDRTGARRTECFYLIGDDTILGATSTSTPLLRCSSQRIAPSLAAVRLRVIRSRQHFARPRASSLLKCLARVGWQQPISAAISACLMGEIPPGDCLMTPGRRPFKATASRRRKVEEMAAKGT